MGTRAERLEVAQQHLVAEGELRRARAAVRADRGSDAARARLAAAEATWAQVEAEALRLIRESAHAGQL